jgi:deazaflavin-dependent oxidoreductase (nitroreductase family)
MAERYRKPAWFVTHLFNPLVAFLTRRGLSVFGSRVLAVRGRTSGQWRTTPVNPLDYQGQRYLVSPRGATQWVRNLRAGGEAELRVGSRVEPIRAEELPDAEKPEILRAYLKIWAFEVGQFFEGVGADASDEALHAIGPKHPVFRITAPRP